MAKEKVNSEVYAEVISAIAARAASSVDGAELLGNKAGRFRFVKHNDVHAYPSADNTVKLDVYINVVYGRNIPEVVCRIQSEVKDAIERETCYSVDEVNVTVVSIVPEDESGHGLSCGIPEGGENAEAAPAPEAPEGAAPGEETPPDGGEEVSEG